ncbi:Uncharacterised protein [Budvicia aquatica]|uniref:Uncharacterized protein n=1 Tax=Budvicia aquatica TaxID=82979 RepID=A0A484ZK13_9GAMM|nr:Uncharacterised protein [Budvicia aquatica]
MFKYMCQSGFNITSPVLADTGVTIPAGHPYGKATITQDILKMCAKTSIQLILLRINQKSLHLTE